MKLLLPAASVAAVLAAGGAAAQTAPAAEFYGALGYSHYTTETDGDDVSLGTVDGRLGARFGRYIGVEGEVGFGVKEEEIVPDDIACAQVLGVDCSVDLKIENKIAGYLVGFLPLSEQADLFARVGYGRVEVEAEAESFDVEVDADDEAFAFGAGGQFFLDAFNGVRAEYTRFEFDEGGDVGSYSLSYVRKF